MNLTTDPIWPLYRVLSVVAALVVLVMTTYPKRVRHLRPFDRRVLIGLRLATVGLIALAMLRPVLHVKTSDTETRFFYILTDSSRSMNVPNGVGSSSKRTRRDQLLKTVAESQEFLKELGENVEIRYLDFSDSLDNVEELSNVAEGRETNMAGALRELLKQTRDKNVLGVVLMGDGAPRVIRADKNIDERERVVDAAREFREQGIRISAVPIGGTGAVPSSADLIVQDIQFNTKPYEGNIVRVTANIRAIGAQGQRLTARILVEDREGRQPPALGKMIEAIPLKTSKPKDNNIVPKENDEVIGQLELSFVPHRPGKYKIAFQIDGLRDEQNKGNNTITRIIDVQSGGISVAYFDRIRPEQKWVRNVSASDKIQLDYFRVNTERGFGPPTKIDPEIFQTGPGEYDVFIIGDVPARIFRNDILAALKKRIKGGAGFMMIGGYDSFGAGGYAGTPLDEVLPVEMTHNDFTARQANAKSPLLHHNRQLQMIPTTIGLTRFVMKIGGDGATEKETKALWGKLAPLEDANRLKKKKTAGGDNENLVEVLANAPDGTPLLISHIWSGARVLAFGGDTTYQWYLNGQQEIHQKFWRQVILFLAGIDEGSEPVFARIKKGGRRTFGLEDKIPLEFGSRDEKGNAMLDLNYEIQITGPPRPENPEKPFDKRLQVTGDLPDNFRELDGLKIPGEYWIRVVGRKKDPQKTMVGTAWERFLVVSTDLEMDNTSPDPDLLKQIAGVTGGTFVQKPEDYADFLKRLSQPEDDLSGTEPVTLWDTWPHLDKEGDSYLPGLLLLFVLLISLEWFIRKRRGLV